jgi:hypothetical protein
MSQREEGENHTTGVFFEYLKEASIGWDGHTDSQEGKIETFKSDWNSFLENNPLSKPIKICKDDKKIDLSLLICINEIPEEIVNNCKYRESILKLIDDGILNEKKDRKYMFRFSGKYLKEKLEKELEPDEAQNIWEFAKKYHYYNFQKMNFRGLDFSEFKFDYFVRFNNSIFHGFANFSKVKFKQGVSFFGSKFEGNAFFDSVEFFKETTFTIVEFKERVSFNHLQLNGSSWMDFSELRTLKGVFFGGREDSDKRNLSFSPFNFKSAVIGSGFYFDVETKCLVDFSHTNFLIDPIIKDRKEWKEKNSDNDNKEEAYRWLKNYYKNRNDYKRELDYFMLEMDEKYNSLNKSIHKALFCIYKWVSNYGTSYLRPLVCLLFCSVGLFFYETYRAGYLYELEFNIKVLLPFIDTGKPVNKWYEIVFSIVNFLLLFLFGLGLRNQFKLR